MKFGGVISEGQANSESTERVAYSELFSQAIGCRSAGRIFLTQKLLPRGLTVPEGISLRKASPFQESSGKRIKIKRS